MLCSEADRRGSGEEDKTDKAERESERRRIEEKWQAVLWDTDQERACWIARSSADTLTQCGPAWKDKEKSEEHEEQVMKTPEPPGPN